MIVLYHLVVDQEIGEVDDGFRGNVVKHLQWGRHSPRVDLKQIDVVNPVVQKEKMCRLLIQRVATVHVL